MLDLTGRSVMDQGRQAGQFTMVPSHLAPGPYLLQWTNENGASDLPVEVAGDAAPKMAEGPRGVGWWLM